MITYFKWRDCKMWMWNQTSVSMPYRFNFQWKLKWQEKKELHLWQIVFSWCSLCRFHATNGWIQCYHTICPGVVVMVRTRYFISIIAIFFAERYHCIQFESCLHTNNNKKKKQILTKKRLRYRVDSEFYSQNVSPFWCIFCVFRRFFSYFFPERKYKCSCNFPAARVSFELKAVEWKVLKALSSINHFSSPFANGIRICLRLKNAEIFFVLYSIDMRHENFCMEECFICVTVESIIPSGMENFGENFNERICKKSQIKWI